MTAFEPKLTHYTPDDERASELLVGRRITEATMDSESLPLLDNYSGRHMAGRLTLDDGTVIYVEPNEGGCSCGAGDYDLVQLSTIDNVITSVRTTVEGTGADYDDKSYRIYVISGNQEINAIQVDGNDGNGYYGTGYALHVVLPSAVSGNTLSE